MASFQYKIKAGETLYGISKRYDVAIEEICRLNRIKDANLIFKGQVLQIPSRQASGSRIASQLAGGRSKGPGEVIYGFQGAFPSPQELATRMAGFHRWAIFTMEHPVTELAQHRQYGAMPLAFGQPVYQHEQAFPALSYGRNGAATGALIHAAWPYYYRFLASYDPALSQIMAGQPLVPKSPAGGPSSFKAASSRAEMTFRHTRPGGNVLKVGTDRISTGKNLGRIIQGSSTRGTGQVVRIDPRVVKQGGGTFFSAREVLADLKKFEQATVRELDEASRGGRGQNHLDRLRKRLSAVNQSRTHVRSYGEGHGVNSIPAKSISPIKSLKAELYASRATQGLRFTGGVLVVYGAYESVDRIASAPAAQRPRVATQEAGAWAGGFAGAWAVGQVFAAGGAALGVATGPGAVVTGIIGGVVGGILGGIGGAMGADWVYARINDQ
ncbi:LysM domain-containing protein [Corallococcus sp. AB011P]|uniref:LysM peptidoglycan-binding domain-containing protein n=1 Tax=Corallococcus sp. AB011P TaxID=2316735 RepID=UPI0013158773|nr:LysM peptidoglycan-binding domain-containing protein [Corallococcus sp. AB011P]